jgi:hypothetical protein
MASAKKSTSNRVKPVSSAAKVRMADTKATKAAAAKAPRYPRGQQGWGMDTSKGYVYVTRGPLSNPDDPSGKMTTTVRAAANTVNKKNANSLMKAALKSKAAGVTGKTNYKYSGEEEYGQYGNTRELSAKKQPKVTVKKKSTKKK